MSMSIMFGVNVCHAASVELTVSDRERQLTTRRQRCENNTTPLRCSDKLRIGREWANISNSTH